MSKLAGELGRTAIRHRVEIVVVEHGGVVLVVVVNGLAGRGDQHVV